MVQIALHWERRLGDFFKFWLGPEVKIVVKDPNDVEVNLCVFHSKTKGRKLFHTFSMLICMHENSQIILSNVRYIDKASEYDFFKNWMHDGLLLSTGT